MDALRKAKNELKDQVKRLALDLSKIETFSGLIALEPKLDQIKERLTVLKYFENPATSVLFKSSQGNAPEKTLEVDRIAPPEVMDYTADEPFSPSAKKINRRLIRIDLNDKIAFVKKLFSGDQSAFDRMMADLNKLDTRQAAEQYIKRWAAEQNHPEKEPYLKRLTALVDQRFNR